jgi:hypothetical protein
MGDGDEWGIDGVDLIVNQFIIFKEYDAGR